MQRPVFVMLWIALVIESGWILLNGTWWHHTPGVDAFGLVITGFLVFFALAGRWRWPATGVRFLVALEFLLSVADRFGVLGAPGSPGVYWGDFDHFVDYTRQVVTFLPAGLAPTLAVLATVAEALLGAALLLGVRTRPAALGSAALLLVYAVSMAVSLPAADLFHFVVLPLCAAMPVLAAAGPTPLSLDAVAAGRRAGRADYAGSIRPSR